VLDADSLVSPPPQANKAKANTNRVDCSFIFYNLRLVILKAKFKGKIILDSILIEIKLSNFRKRFVRFLLK